MASCEEIIAKRTENVKNIFSSIPRGQPKSGRKWKSARSARHMLSGLSEGTEQGQEISAQKTCHVATCLTELLKRSSFKHSEIKKVKSLKSSWNKKMSKKAEKKSIKDFQSRLKEERSKELEQKRIRREENQKRREQNALKSEVVQTRGWAIIRGISVTKENSAEEIKSTAKIKRMKKKQLRQLAKR